MLAHANPHRVTGITLPPVDARDFTFCSFIVVPGLGEAMKKEEERKTALSPQPLLSSNSEPVFVCCYTGASCSLPISLA